MTVSLFDSALYRTLLSDDEAAALFSDAAELRAMLRFEAALAHVQGRLGVIPQEAAVRISALAATLDLEPASLAAETTGSGMPVPGLVARLRAAVAGEPAAFVHWGATSQDVVDTGLVLRLRDCVELFTGRLDRLIDTLADQAERHRHTVMAARTRSQPATPTTLGLKIAGWLAPLLRHRDRLAELRPRLLLLQFGGASGTLAALGDQGPAVMEALAAELDLALPPAPWHAQRDGIAEFAGWLALVTGSLGKIAQDLILHGQSEVGELRAGTGGGSSTMPQKSNPVGAEVLVALARFNGQLLGGLHQAMLHAQERDGAAWALEWLTLPQMTVATASGLRHAQALAETLVADEHRMAENVAASHGLVLAEAATFALARHMPRPEAEALVKDACQDCLASRRHLVEVLAERSDAPVAWDDLRRPASHVGSADLFVDRVLRAAR